MALHTLGTTGPRTFAGKLERAKGLGFWGGVLPPLAREWDDPRRWRLISSGPWTRTSEHINIKEAQIEPDFGTTALTLTDSLVSCLALEKGRSGSTGLNGICRRAAAYPSRQWGPDFERKGYAPKKRRMDVNESPSWHLHPLRRLTPRARARGLRLLLLLRPPRKRPSISSRSSRARLGSRKHLLDMGSGCYQTWRFYKGRQFDMLRPSSQKIILDTIKDGKVWAVHFGTPCTVWSRARHNLRNLRRARQKEAVGVALALFTARAIRLCIACNIFFTLENPQTSRLWEFGPIHDLFRNPKTHFFVLHMCGWGAPYKKPTGILTNMTALERLVRKCTRDHEHVALRGTERVVLDGQLRTRNRTAGAGAYPPALCDAWAQILKAQSPPEGRGQATKGDTVDFLNGLEAAAARTHPLLHMPETLFKQATTTRTTSSPISWTPAGTSAHTQSSSGS